MTAAGTAALAASTTTEGNYGLCHFIFWTWSAAAAGTNDWGQTNYLTEAQWGTNGNKVAGSGMKTGGGTAITLATQGHTLTPVPASGTTTIAAGSKVFFWYQPKYASTYASTALRRYNGGGTEVEKVTAYCVSQRLLATTTHVASGFVKQTTVTTLSGASALAAGAIALGVASLAI